MEVVRQWQLQRCDEKGDVADTLERLLQDLLRLQHERRRLTKTLEISRRKVKDMQNQLRPVQSGKLCDDVNWHEKVAATRTEISVMKTETIPVLQKALQECMEKFEDYLPMLCNVCDGTAFRLSPELQTFDETLGEVCHNMTEVRSDYFDPLFCLGGYEKVMMHTSKSKREEKGIISAIGSTLMDAISSYAKSVFEISKGPTTDYQLIHLPSSTPLSTTIARSIMGCPRFRPGVDRTSASSSELIDLPSYVTLYMIHENKMYSDKNLPIRYFAISNQATGDHKPRRAKSAHTFQHNFAHHTEQVELFALSTCNLNSSREIQDEMAHYIYRFYKSLLSKSHLDHQSQSGDNVSKCVFIRDKCNILRIQQEPPSRLDPNEARRVTIQGYFPSKKSYVDIGHVSNFTDYMSRSFNIKCVGSCNTSNEYVHTIHGILYDSSILQFVVENNIAMQGKSSGNHGKLGMLVPCALSSEIGIEKRSIGFGERIETATEDEDYLFLPFQRKQRKGKGGKLNVEDIKNMPLDYSSQEGKKERMSDACNRVGGLGIVDGEAICNPYEFLPM